MKPGSYSLDPVRSQIRFEATNLMVLSVRGRFQRFQGKVLVAPNFADSKVEAEIDLDSVDTDWKGRDEHLRKDDFLDVKRFPRMHFQSTRVEGTPREFRLAGILDLHGCPREVTLEVREISEGRLHASGEIDRRDFGLTAGPTIRNRIRIELDLQLQENPAEA